MRFRKKPIVIEAIRFLDYETDKQAVEAFVGGDLSWAKGPPLLPVIYTLEGDTLVSPGDWIIKGVNGEFYPCKDDIFGEIYEPVCSLTQ